MKSNFKWSWRFVVVASGLSLSINPINATAGNFGTKTPYQPQQAMRTYETAPKGFAPIFTQAVVRHGSRGLSSLKHDGALYRMWQKAKDDNALTPLGVSFGADLAAVMQANAALGRGVAGISQAGYGNLTLRGMGEQREIAQRLRERLPDFWLRVADSSAKPRPIQVVTSGVDRAVDSSQFFVNSLTKNNAALSGLLTPTPALTQYPANAPAAQPLGVNRYLLYFHKLKPTADLVTDPTDMHYKTYQASMGYQASADNEAVKEKIKSVKKSDELKTARKKALSRLFKPKFIDKLGDKGYQFANDGEFAFTDNEGKTFTLKGEGDSEITKPLDAAVALYNVYAITPAMSLELGAPLLKRFSTYMPDADAKSFAYLADTKDFYNNGPSIAGEKHVTFDMAQGLLDDFFKQTDDVVQNRSRQAAVLRFGHAEIVMPFVALLGIKGQSESLSANQTYTRRNSAWRGELATPLAANVQWDVYRNSAGRVLVKMLFNEKETDFKTACSAARFLPNSHFYDYQGLRKCYGVP